jgi:hypothetical protein
MQDETTVTTEAPEDFAAFEEWRNTGKAPEAAEETPAADEAKTTPPASESGNPSGEEDEERTDKSVKGVQKRIDELTKARREAERRAEEAERKLAETQGSRPAKENAPAAPIVEGKPKLEDFNTLEEFQEALTDWKIDQRETARESKAREEVGKAAWSERETTFKEAHADYDEVLEKIAIPAKAPALQAIQAAVAKGGPELLYHLGQNPEDVARIAGLAPLDAVLELGQIMAGFGGKKATPEKPQPKLSSAPKPPARVGGAAPAAKAIGDSDLNYEEHEKLMAARDKRRR